MVKRKSKMLFVATMCISLLGTFISANAKDNINKIEAKEKLEMKRWLKENEVDDRNIDKLINKLDKGEKWDSFNPNNQHKEKIKKGLKGWEKKEIFEDGSVIVSGVDLSEATVVTYDNENEDILSLIKPFGGVDTSTGNKQNGSGYIFYTNAKVYHSTAGLVRAEFYANFTLSPYGGEITKVYNESIKCIPVLTSSREVSLVIDQRKSAYYPAQATLSFIMDSVAGDQFMYLKLKVTTDNYWADPYMGNPQK